MLTSVRTVGNDEGRMTKSARNSQANSAFVIRIFSSFVIRHSFDLRHFPAPSREMQQGYEKSSSRT
jgi:hypothetical protein